MRVGLTVSVIAHVALLAWGVFSLPVMQLDASDLETIPIEFVSIDDITSIDAGLLTAELQEQETPVEPVEEAVEEEPPPLPIPPPEPDPVPPPPPEPVPPPPPPEPEPVPPEPEPQPPEPEPAPEPVPAPPPEPAPEPEPQVEAEPPPPEPEPVAEEPPPEELQVASLPPEQVPVPRARPERPVPPPQPQVAEPEEEPDLVDEITSVLQRTDTEPEPQAEPEPSPSAEPTLGGNTPTLNARMTVNELDALRARLASCWNIQLAPPDPDDMRVKVKMYLNLDGTLAQAPEVVEARSNQYAQSAAEAALRAVRRCAPYNLPAEKYDSWQEIVVTFDPREMFGG